jgi:hypothetical protein
MVDSRAPRWHVGIFDWSALLVPLAVGAGLVIYGLEAANTQSGSEGGDPAAAYFILGSVALLFAARDARSYAAAFLAHNARICNDVRPLQWTTVSGMPI